MMKDAFLARDTIYYENLNLQKNVEIWEDGLRTNGSKNSFEWWYFDAEYTNGYKVVVIFYTKNRFDVKGPSMPYASIDITLPNGNSITKVIYEEQNEINASKDKCDVKICDSNIKYVDGDYIIDFVCPELHYKCILKPTFPMWRPETGHIYFGQDCNKYFAWLVAVPSGTCTSSLQLEDKIIEMSGTGYHDHNWGNCSMKKVIDNWYWCRTNIDKYTIIAFDIISKKKYNSSRIPLILIGKDNEIINLNSNRLTLNRALPTIHPLTKKLIHNDLSIIEFLDNDIYMKLNFLRDHDILATNLLNSFGFTRLKVLFLNIIKKMPTYLRCIGMVTLTVKEKDKEYTFEKEGIWEQMYLSSK